MAENDKRRGIIKRRPPNTEKTAVKPAVQTNTVTSNP